MASTAAELMPAPPPPSLLWRLAPPPPPSLRLRLPLPGAPEGAWRSARSAAAAAAACSFCWRAARLVRKVEYSDSKRSRIFLHISRSMRFSVLSALNLMQLAKMRRHSSANTVCVCTMPLCTRENSVLMSMGCFTMSRYCGMFSATGSMGSANHLYLRASEASGKDGSVEGIWGGRGGERRAGERKGRRLLA
jgi:hypothetical protein